MKSIMIVGEWQNLEQFATMAIPPLISHAIQEEAPHHRHDHLAVVTVYFDNGKIHEVEAGGRAYDNTGGWIIR